MKDGDSKTIYYSAAVVSKVIDDVFLSVQVDGKEVAAKNQKLTDLSFAFSGLTTKSSPPGMPPRVSPVIYANWGKTTKDVSPGIGLMNVQYAGPDIGGDSKLKLYFTILGQGPQTGKAVFSHFENAVAPTADGFPYGGRISEPGKYPLYIVGLRTKDGKRAYQTQTGLAGRLQVAVVSGSDPKKAFAGDNGFPVEGVTLSKGFSVSAIPIGMEITKAEQLLMLPRRDREGKKLETGKIKGFDVYYADLGIKYSLQCVSDSGSIKDLDWVVHMEVVNVTDVVGVFKSVFYN